MKTHPLVIYFIFLALFCGAVIAVAKGTGQMYYAQGYMLTPALAAIVTRLFFYKPHFRDANLRFGKLSDYFHFWLIGLGFTAMSLAFMTLFSAVVWDFSGSTFLTRLADQFTAAGQDIYQGLPAGWTPQTMMFVYFVAALTVLNIMPGVITGFGEEFGHRGFMFPMLYRMNPWAGFLIGGLIWFAWHWPLVLIAPSQPETPAWQAVLNFLTTGVGSLLTFAYLAYVYVKSRSVFVAAIAHIVMNNSSAAFSVFVTVQNQFLANVAVVASMAIIVGILYYKKEFGVFLLGDEDSDPEVRSERGALRVFEDPKALVGAGRGGRR